MLSLTIHHNIHLTKQQRYALHEGQDIVVVGVSIPVWIADKMTSEPAKEVFCNYYLKNPKEEIPIRILDDGYEITIPYREGKDLNLSNEEWRELNMNDPEKLQEMYENLESEVSSKNLLDIEDGGSEFLNYRELNKVPSEDKFLNIMHHIVISKMENR